MDKIRLVNGKILLHNGKIAISDDCCCNGEPCDMTAVVLVDFECPCGGYGGADDEEIRATFTLITKDGVDVMNDPWPSYITGGNGGNHIHLRGGVFDDESGGTPSGYEPGENRITYTKPCWEEIFDENSLRITSANFAYGGIEFSRSEWDDETKTITYHYRIKNGVLINTVTGEPYTVKRPLRIVVEHGVCCWEGNPDDPGYLSATFLIDGNETTLQATKRHVELGGSKLVVVFDTGMNVSVPVCGEGPIEDGPDVRVLDYMYSQSTHGIFCCKDEDTGGVYACVTFGCSYGKDIRLPIVIDDDCACPAYAQLWASDVAAMIAGYHPDFGLVVDCDSGIWGEPVIEGTYPNYYVTATCCCLNDCQNEHIDVSFVSGSGVAWNGAVFTVDENEIRIRPKIPVQIDLRIVDNDGHAACICLDDKGDPDLPDPLFVNIGGESIGLSIDNGHYVGAGTIPCTSSDPTISVDYGNRLMDLDATIQCNSSYGYSATGSIKVRKVRVTIVQTIDVDDLVGEYCVNPMYHVGGTTIVRDMPYEVHGAPINDMSPTYTTYGVCIDDLAGKTPSELAAWAASHFSMDLDTEHQPGVALEVPSGGYGDIYECTYANCILTVKWKVVCNSQKAVIVIDNPAECSIDPPRDGHGNQIGWQNGNKYVIIVPPSVARPDLFCSCKQLLDWPSSPPPGEETFVSAGYPRGVPVEITVADITGYWQIAQQNGISNFDCSGEIDGTTIQFTFDATNYLWSYRGTLSADATQMPEWTFYGPVYGHQDGEYVPTKTGTFYCSKNQDNQDTLTAHEAV